MREDVYSILIERIHYLNNQNKEVQARYLNLANSIFNILIKEQIFKIKVCLKQVLYMEAVGQLKESEVILKRLLKLLPDNYFFVRKLVKILVKEKKYEEDWSYIQKYEKYVEKDTVLKNVYLELRKKMEQV